VLLESPKWLQNILLSRTGKFLDENYTINQNNKKACQKVNFGGAKNCLKSIKSQFLRQKDALDA